ncbi:MAG: hypothetical protein MUC80_06890 [Candidatus Thermoplasmatota archaeon]|jgi:hypothetical protein|nr:hypothetical protein [Candidatus Thermoplasmatota archaeon]
MSKTTNSVLAKHVFDALFKVVGRRTLDSFAVQILKTTLEKLQKRYEFLSLVIIHDDLFSEDGIHATFDTTFDQIDPSQLGEALEVLLRIIYLELIETIGNDVGLYFVKELKQHLGDEFTDELREKGVQFERIESQQYSRDKIKGWPGSPSSLKENLEQPIYTWEAVSTWKYQDNICLLYDSDGRLLDSLQLDLLIEDYVERVTESQKNPTMPSPKTMMLKLTEKEHELLQMMQHRDLDGESAVILLHVSRQKFESMIKKLLQMEMLQYQSEKEVRLTEKGLQYLTDFQKK